MGGLISSSREPKAVKGRMDSLFQNTNNSSFLRQVPQGFQQQFSVPLSLISDYIVYKKDRRLDWVTEINSGRNGEARESTTVGKGKQEASLLAPF